MKQLAIAFTNENGNTRFDDGYSNPGSNNFAGAKKFDTIEELFKYAEEKGCISSCWVVDENENVILEKLQQYIDMSEKIKESGGLQEGEKDGVKQYILNTSFGAYLASELKLIENKN